MDTLIEQKAVKLYSRKHLILACFLSGPIGGSLLMARNYKSIGKEEKKREAVMIGMGVSLIMMLISIKLHIITLPLAMLNLLAMEKWYIVDQLEIFNSHVNKGGKVHTWKAAFLHCLISIAIGFVAAVLFCTVVNVVLQ